MHSHGNHLIVATSVKAGVKVYDSVYEIMHG